jgi:hypothetical protein
LLVSVATLTPGDRHPVIARHRRFLSRFEKPSAVLGAADNRQCVAPLNLANLVAKEEFGGS